MTWYSTGTMPHPNEAVIRKLLVVCAPDCRDPNVLGEFLDDEAVYHIPGWNTVSGEYKGRDEIIQLVTRRAELLGQRQHRVEFLGTSVSGEHVAMLHQYDAEVRGKRLTWRGNSVYFLRHGKIVECWLFVDDEEVFNEFWGA